MKTINIYHTVLYDYKNKKFKIGGIETYILNLCKSFSRHGYNVNIFQYSSDSFKLEYDYMKIIGIPIKQSVLTFRSKKDLVDGSLEYVNPEDDIFIYSTHSLLTNHKFKYKIAIQHGITFDIVNYEENKKFKEFGNSIVRFMKGLNTVRHIRKTEYLVAVDYNFLNWYRTMPFFKNIPISVIPNFTEIHNLKKNDSDENYTIKIIFARRFEKYRGTRLFSKVAEELLKNYDNLIITFAGSGPDEKFLRENFENESRVNFIEYKSNESYKIHSSHDIAVIPTLGSEGTSLSLLEAMSSGCAVVATNVGGMTNIILDGFNGKLVDPDYSDIYKAIEKLIRNSDLRNSLADNAKKTVEASFSISKWEIKWMNLIGNVEKGD